jgi:hypothetical protein
LVIFELFPNPKIPGLREKRRFFYSTPPGLFVTPVRGKNQAADRSGGYSITAKPLRPSQQWRP